MSVSFNRMPAMPPDLGSIQVADRRALELIEPMNLRLIHSGFIAMGGQQLVEDGEGTLSLNEAVNSSESRLVTAKAVALVVVAGLEIESSEVAALYARAVTGEDLIYGASLPGFSVLPIVD